MAPWEWSHASDAYENARQQLAGLPMSTLKTICEEWVESGVSLPEWRSVPVDVVIEQLWDLVEQQRMCDIGGFNAWVCPEGCHLVPFGPPKGAAKRRARQRGFMPDD